jgi:hypothetical protein
MAKVLRPLGAIVAATLAAILLLVAVELFSAVVHPLPADFDNTREAMCAHVERYPPWVLAAVVPMWAAIALISTAVAGRLGNRATALVAGAQLLAALLSNVAMLPYPTWFKIAELITLPLGVVAGVYWCRPARRTIVAAS